MLVHFVKNYIRIIFNSVLVIAIEDNLSWLKDQKKVDPKVVPEWYSKEVF